MISEKEYEAHLALGKCLERQYFCEVNNTGDSFDVRLGLNCAERHLFYPSIPGVNYYLENGFVVFDHAYAGFWKRSWSDQDKWHIRSLICQFCQPLIKRTPTIFPTHSQGYNVPARWYVMQVLSSYKK